MTYPTATDILVALRDYGVPTIEHGDWRRRGTVYDASFVGHMNHHDALSEAVTDERALRLMVEGRSDLPGPLCNGWGDSDGVYYLVAYGNANHAGWGEQDVLDRVKVGATPTGDARLDPDSDAVVGNTWFWGTEWRNAGDGRDPYEQLDTMIKVNAALVDVFNWPNANVCIGHKEWTRRKIDPAGFDMFEFRRLVTLRLGMLSPQPTPTTYEEDDEMQLPGKIVKGDVQAPWFITDGVTKQWIQDRTYATLLINQGVAKAEVGTGNMANVAETKPFVWPQGVVDQIRLVGKTPA